MWRCNWLDTYGTELVDSTVLMVLVTSLRGAKAVINDPEEDSTGAVTAGEFAMLRMLLFGMQCGAGTILLLFTERALVHDEDDVILLVVL